MTAWSSVETESLDKNNRENKQSNDNKDFRWKRKTLIKKRSHVFDFLSTE